jgi:5'-nucleotidase
MGPWHPRGGRGSGRGGGRGLTSSTGDRRVLVTNDDGVDAVGLAALAESIAALDYDVVVAAPARDHSGASSAIGPLAIGEGVEVTSVELEALPGIPAFAVDAPPALSVILSRLGAFGEPPDLVVSGINPGPNTGRSVLHSGTVGAALTAANMGISGLAISIGTGQPSHLETAATVAATGLAWLAAAPRKSVLNINVPNLPLAEVLGVRAAPLARFGTVRTALGQRADGRLQVELRDTEDQLDPDTDTALVRAGYVTVTSLLGIRADEDSDAPAVVEESLGFSPAAG